MNHTKNPTSQNADDIVLNKYEIALKNLSEPQLIIG